ncbi:CaiB/BaiF CoA transferase family protein [Parvularcula lutaonensis]|uniref:CaiB/BaiF CoA transferase family protein n=1 Tax=Parvularcula lutaonensis TaxID=491923 RepID=A0ABV7MCH7_9PROT|nr:CoA transferase [Parvularcula lutaonensis]GGY38628.1 CoA transferase [Parvularcula lutaonensis]
MTGRPLSGIRVLSVEQYGAGPYGTMLLADLGAEVIKIEDPDRGGDISRSVGPFTLGEGDSQFFQTFSLGKKSVALNLKTEEGRSAFERLVQDADAVVNNLRGDQPAKLRLTYPDLCESNPAIVCAHLSAYGREGERADWPGYDYLMQAEAGFMSLTGEPDGPPVRFGLSMVDYQSGSQLATAVLAGIIGAKRTGRGCDMDVALFDTALHQLSYPGTWYLNEKYVTGRLPRGSHPSITPSQLVKTKDAWGLLMCQTPKFWDLWCKIAGAEHLQADERFSSIPSRRENLAALSDEVDKVMMARTTDEWTELLGGKVPFAPVYDIAQALDNPYVQSVAMTSEIDHPDRDRPLRVLSSPFRINGERPTPHRAPKMGEHTKEFLK